MNTIQLSPNDVLFFRDGRPMDGSSSGHGAAWPLPHVINAAFHAALHRAEIEGVHEHRTGRSSDRSSEARDQRFGSLTTVGPFPVGPEDQWFFPRPADAQARQSSKTTLRPLIERSDPSSLPNDLAPVINTEPPTKNHPEPWMNANAWEAYLAGTDFTTPSAFVVDTAFADAEHQIGIAIDPGTESTIDGKFYSASYLRLRPEWRMGILAEALDKVKGDPENRRDLIRSLLDHDQHIIVGGQQRVCGAKLEKSDQGLPLPTARMVAGTRVRWTLLSPAVFPAIEDQPGGWLPSWVDSKTNRVQLLDGPGRNKAKRLGVKAGQPIEAKLVASVIPRSIPVTGWALGCEGGAKSSHLAVPAGSVYYFEADDEANAQKLATALNWHGEKTENPDTIINRRSTLFGEKGFGLGLCSTWHPHDLSLS